MHIKQTHKSTARPPLARICNPCQILKVWKVYVLFPPVGGLNYNRRLQNYVLIKGFKIFLRKPSEQSLNKIQILQMTY
jgi:hypothetical protein